MKNLTKVYCLLGICLFFLSFLGVEAFADSAQGEKKEVAKIERPHEGRDDKRDRPRDAHHAYRVPKHGKRHHHKGKYYYHHRRHHHKHHRKDRHFHQEERRHHDEYSRKNEYRFLDH